MMKVPTERTQESDDLFHGMQPLRQLEPLRDRLLAVREAQRLFGLDAARIAWRELGLPGTPVVAEPAPRQRSEHNSVEVFLQECIVRDDARETVAHVVYSAYCRWCDALGFTPRTSTAFGRGASAVGIAKRQSHHVYYVGVELPDGEGGRARTGRQRTSVQ